MTEQRIIELTPSPKWQTVALDNVAEIINGGTPKSKVPAYWGGDIQWLTPKEMGTAKNRSVSNTTRTITREGLAKSSARLAPPNSVILSTRAPIGHLAVNAVEMAFNQGCRGIVPGKELDPVFLYYFLDANRQELNKLGTGATFKELSATKLKSIKLPLPPVEEQKRIVAELDQAFAALNRARAHAEANLLDADALFAAFLNETFDSITESTTAKPLIDLCASRGITYGVIKLGDHIEEGVPCLRTSNVKRLRIVTNGMKHIAPSLSAEYSRTILQGGEVLVNVRGTLGGVAVAKENMIGWNISREVAMVDVATANPFFVCYFISGAVAQAWLTGVTKGAAYKGINLSDLRKLNIPFPALDKQREIVKSFDARRKQVDQLEIDFAAKLIDIANLRQSLLQKAFSGELT